MDVNALRRYAALTMMLLASGVSLAQTPTVADLDKIQAETLRLKAEGSRAKAAKDLAELRGENPAITATDDGGGLPVARGVFGGNGTRYVAFVYPTGGTAEAAEGGRIPGDYTVKSFDTAGVVLMKGKRTYRIPFSMQAPTPATVVPAARPGASFGVPTLGAPLTGPVTPVPPIR